MIRVGFIILVLFELRILEVDIGDSELVLDVLGIVDTIGNITCRKPFELHDILRQGASLVTEDIVHHAEFFIQV